MGLPLLVPVPTAEALMRLIGSLDPVPSGGVLTYSLVVSNRGGAAGGTTVFIAIPTGTEGSSVGPN